MEADDAARDFGWPPGMTQGESPQRALTEEQQRGQAKVRQKFGRLVRLKSLIRALMKAGSNPNGAARIYEMASLKH